MANALTEGLTPEEVKILNKAWFRSLFVSWCSNQVVQQAHTYAWAMSAGLDVWYKDDQEKRDEAFCMYADEYFNSNATTFPLCVGITLSMEKERAEEGTVDATAISSVKASLIGPTSAIGDAFFFNCVRVLLAGIAISLSAGGNILGPLFFLVTFAGIRLGCGYVFMFLGYKSGTTFVTSAVNSGTMTLITECAAALGAIMVGALIATNVTVKLTWEPNLFGAVVNMQEILDQIMPGMLSLILWYVCTRAIRKGRSPVTLIVVIIVVCLILSLLGIV